MSRLVGRVEPMTEGSARKLRRAIRNTTRWITDHRGPRLARVDENSTAPAVPPVYIYETTIRIQNHARARVRRPVNPYRNAGRSCSVLASQCADSSLVRSEQGSVRGPGAEHQTAHPGPQSGHARNIG